VENQETFTGRIAGTSKDSDLIPLEYKLNAVLESCAFQLSKITPR
jgi:hypothetical protein